jgi:hypothetical protein
MLKTNAVWKNAFGCPQVTIRRMSARWGIKSHFIRIRFPSESTRRELYTCNVSFKHDLVSRQYDLFSQIVCPSSSASFPQQTWNKRRFWNWFTLRRLWGRILDGCMVMPSMCERIVQGCQLHYK